VKHRGLWFTILFAGCLFLLYMQPVWFPPVSSEPNKSEIRREPSPTTWNYEPIKTDGYARWIGRNLSDFDKAYGRAEETYSSGFSFVIHRYAMDEQNYLEVTTEKKRITSIKVLGDQSDKIQPFSFGMTMNDLAQITMIYPNFSINHEGRTISFELMEDDMNYRPLIAFDNGSFAMLLFSPNELDNSLFSVIYLDKETLLKLQPYQITEGVPPHFNAAENADWEVINQSKEKQSKDLFQLFRMRDGLEAFDLTTDVQIESESLLGKFFANPEDYLTTERAQKLHRAQEAFYSDNFALSNGEIEDFLKTLDITDAKLYLELPVYDPTFSILSWYSIPYSHTRYMHPTLEALGIAFSKENVVVLLQNAEKITESGGVQ